jgi:hypothetical protein
MRMSLGGPHKKVDPAADASKKGKVPTLGDVQKSLKVCTPVNLFITVLNVCYSAIDKDTHSSDDSYGDFTK